ncbi:MarR family winged helix-turn-helix transcriptional regulator [Pseudonocardia sp. ICBG1034]|uniref:MarR family winged helix-turn-helix transcriptional regulator n=1 Tax=Pseudonocardia sp. ICBG1034 TaxID=2844381 RepID=UPI001CCD490E|nr:MarR family transcriptional regulator [Pseudonocardia sp. ICBG1034]
MQTDELVRQVPRVLNPFARLIRRAVRADPPLPLVPYAQVEVLRVLEDSPDLSVRAVADVLQLAPNTVSTLVRALVEVGYVRQSPGHGRSTRLRLTATARDVIDVWDERRAALLQTVLGRLSEADRAAIGAAVEPLLRLQDELERAQQSGPARSRPVAADG